VTAPSTYWRDDFTWRSFAVLGAFGVLNSVLGASLPYLRATERISYVVGSLHQVAFALGGGLAGWLATRAGGLSRALVIRAGMVAAAVAALGIGYGDRAWITIAAAFLMSLFATSSLIRVWAALADAHGDWRTVAMTEGEMTVSAGGVLTPLLLGSLATTVLGWRFAFVAAAVIVLVSVAVSLPVSIPEAETTAAPAGEAQRTGISSSLLAVFAIVALEFSLSFWLASYLSDSVGLGRGLAATLVSVLYGANFAGRLIASRLARRLAPSQLLAGSLLVALIGVGVLLSATDIAVALVGIGLAGAGIGANFPLISSLYVSNDERHSDAALGDVLTIASAGQIIGPVAVGLIAQAAGLRVGLVVLPALTLLALGALAGTRRNGTRPAS
jgi:MFS family permease